MGMIIHGQLSIISISSVFHDCNCMPTNHKLHEVNKNVPALFLIHRLNNVVATAT